MDVDMLLGLESWVMFIQQDKIVEPFQLNTIEKCFLQSYLSDSYLYQLQ